MKETFLPIPQNRLARVVTCPTCNFHVFLCPNNTIVPHYGIDRKMCPSNNTLFKYEDEFFEDGSPVSMYEKYLKESHDM